MGFIGGLCVFDFQKYVHQIVPALKEGENHPLIARIISQYQHKIDFSNLAVAMKHFDDQLANCSAEMHYPDSRWGFEDLAWLFQHLLLHHCIGQCAVFGQTVNHLSIDLFDEEFEFDDTITLLINELDQKGRYWSLYQPPIRGWLSPQDTSWLDSRLKQLQFENPHSAIRKKLQNYYHNWPNADFLDRHIRHLHLFITTCHKAVQENKGLLWALDLDIFY